MLAEFVNKIQEMARAAIGVSTQRVEGFPNEVFVIQGGTYHRVALPPSPRKQALRTMADLVEYLKDPTIAPAPEVYHSIDGVTAFLDRKVRSETVSLGYERTAKVTRLMELAQSPKAFKVKDLVRFLRIDLDVSAGIVGSFRTIDFERKGTGTNTVVHGRESLGKSVEARVQNADQIPESFLVTAPLFLNKGFEFEVKVLVDVDVNFEQEQIVLSVKRDDLSDEIERCHVEIGADLRERLGGEVPVFFGGSSGRVRPHD